MMSKSLLQFSTRFMGSKKGTATFTTSDSSINVNQKFDDKSVTQIYTSEDELLVYGWIREETEDDMSTDLMHKCLLFHRNNKWIRPDIQYILRIIDKRTDRNDHLCINVFIYRRSANV